MRLGSIRTPSRTSRSGTKLAGAVPSPSSITVLPRGADPIASSVVAVTPAHSNTVLTSSAFQRPATSSRVDHRRPEAGRHLELLGEPVMGQHPHALRDGDVDQQEPHHAAPDDGHRVALPRADCCTAWSDTASGSMVAASASDIASGTGQANSAGTLA